MEVLLIAVVIGMVGFTGYFVWHSQQATKNTLNQTAKTNTSSSKGTTDSKSANTKLRSASMDAAVGKDISFMYPQTWKLETSVLQTSPYIDQKVTVKSPSGSMAVVYEASDGGVGGNCDPAEQGVLTSLHTESVSLFSEANYVEMTYTKGMGSGDTSFAGLMQKTSMSSAKEGSSYCDVYLAGIISLAGSSSSSLHLTAHVEFTDSKVSTDATAFLSALQSPDYVQAKSILLSTVVK